MKRGIAITLFIFSCVFATAQEINWKNTKNWKLYKLNSRAAFSYPADTLHHFESVNLNDDTIRDFLCTASIWPKEKKTVWMGLLIATYETENNQLRKINISNYGGFFFDDFTGKYYELPERVRDQWMNYLNEKLDKLFAQESSVKIGQNDSTSVAHPLCNGRFGFTGNYSSWSYSFYYSFLIMDHCQLGNFIFMDDEYYIVES
jgi:hypothetical protein